MEALPVLFVVVALVSASVSTTAPPAYESIPSCPPAGHSLLSILLQEMGFRDTCVAAALETCVVPPQESQFVTLMKEIKHLLQDVAQDINNIKNRPRHCKDFLDAGDGENGVRMIHPYPGQPDRSLMVYCDQTTDDGGWTVIQRRTNSTIREDFYRTWVEYKLGFGNINAEFWLGLDLLHALTSRGLHELRINLTDWEGGQRYAKYGYFHVENSESKYRLQVGRYIGNAGDGLGDGGHSGSKFSTRDSDNDSHGDSCAQRFRGGWWYNSCHQSNLNGYQHEGNHTSYADGINWSPWRGYHYSLRQTIMMVRPV